MFHLALALLYGITYTIHYITEWIIPRRGNSLYPLLLHKQPLVRKTITKHRIMEAQVSRNIYEPLTEGNESNSVKGLI